ncbi:MAG TPA: tetratricopeptide repeat protein [Blastocatellia bacterium]|nr:tetratricopeptide repeat protein [Blastocatellia bacterium]
MKKQAFALLIILFSFSLCSLAAARAQGNSIRGKVRNSQGRNLGQVIVQLETGNGLPVNTTTTNNEGDFFFNGLSGTSYIVIISAPDYNPVQEHVEFVRLTSSDDPGEQRTVEITLIPKSGAAAPLSNRAVSGQNIPKAAREALDRALALSKQNKSQEAIAALQEAIKAYPDYFDAHFLLGNELMKLNRLQEAIAELEQARKINAKDDRVYQSFGQLLVKQGKYALASQVFAEAARLNPTDANILLMRAGALVEHASAINPAASKEAAERSKALDLAEKDLLKALDMSDHKLAVAYLQLARVYEKKGDKAQAAAALEQYLKTTPDAKNADAIREAIKTLRAPASDKKPAPLN